MRFLLAVISIAVLSAAVEYFLPWWIIALVSLVVSLVLPLRSGKAFLAGFCGVAACWLIAALLRDIPNDHILSGRMAALFHLPNYQLFIVVTVFVGGLIGGLAAWAAALLRPAR